MTGLPNRRLLLDRLQQTLNSQRYAPHHGALMFCDLDRFKQLNDTLGTVLRAPDLAERLAAEAVEPMPMSAEQFGRYVEDDLARWTRLARERKIEVEG